jgi:dihydrofolate reductase
MRKLKLQMDITVDGFVGRPNGNMDWPTFNRDDELKSYSLTNLEGIDCILMILGRNTKMSFIPYWASVANNPKDPNFAYGKRLTEIPKIVFSKAHERSEWANTKVINGEVVEEISKLKKQKGKDIIVFGGAKFASTLIKNRLVDEFHLLVNPVAIGNGLSIFKDLENKLDMSLVEAKSFECGIVWLQYQPKNE